VSSADVSAWQNNLVMRGLKPATQERTLGPLRTFFLWLEQTGRIFGNPCRQLILPRYDKPLQPVPTEAEMLRVLAGIIGDSPRIQRDRAMMEVLYGAGLRRRELAELTTNSIDSESGVVRVFGKGRERVVPLTEAAILAVKRYQEDGRKQLLGGRSSQRLWISKNTRQALSTDYIDNVARSHGRAAGVEIGAQTVRRAFATHMLARGASLADLRLLLGHADYHHLHHYLRYTPRQLMETHRKSRLGK
jgi:integrase/recombinase XerD